MKNYVIINGVNSNTITGLMINELPPITKPQMRAIQEEIDGRDGDITTNLGYSAYDKTITIGLFGTGYDINSIISFFNGEGTIVFSNEADKYYNFKILNQIDYVALQKFKSASITFHCQPFKYPLTETPLEIEYSYVSDEGETISLNTALGEMKVNLLGNTSQTGTPTPDNPIPVNVVSGDNEVVVSNSDGTQSTSYPIHLPVENLLNADTPSITISTNNTSTKAIGTINLVGGTTYYISYTQDKTLTSDTRNTPVLEHNGNRIYQYSTSNANLPAGRKVWEYTPTDTGAYTLEYWCHTPSQEVIFNDFMVSTNPSPTYTPYGTTPIEMCKIGTYQDKFIRNSGKNKFNKDTAIQQRFVNRTTGQLSVGDANDGASDFIDVYGLEKIILSGNNVSYGNGGAFYNQNEEYISGFTSSDIKSGISVPSNAYYVRFSFIYNEINTTMLNEGSTALPYEPYGNGDLYLEKHIGKVVLDGSETGWEQGSTFADYTNFQLSINDIEAYTDGSKTPNIYVNYFTPVSYSETWLPGKVSRITNALRLYFITEPTQTLAGWKTWLGTHNTIVYYQLATPTYTKIEGTLKDELEDVYSASSYKGTTNISQVNNDKAFILNVVAMKEGSNEVQVNNIGNTYSKPLIALEGTGNINIYLDNTQILQANVEDKMNIDIAKLEAYNPDTSVLLNRQVIGNYNSMTIPSGTSIIRMDGELTKATITNYTRYL